MWWRIFISSTVCGSIGFIVVVESSYKSFIGNTVGTTLLFAIIGLVFVGPLWQVIHLIKKGGGNGKTFNSGGQDS